MLSGVSNVGAAIADKGRAVKTGFKKVGMVMAHPIASGSYASEVAKDKIKSGFNKVGDKVGAGVQRAKNYTKKSLAQYNSTRDSNKARNQQRQSVRDAGVTDLKKKIVTGAATHAIKKGAKAVAKRSIGL